MYKIINRKKLFATIIADLIGNIIFSTGRLLKKKGEIRPEEVKDILVIRTAYIGDVVMTIPILKPLKDRFPHARISFLTSTVAAELLKNNPYVDNIIAYNPFWFYPSGKGKYFDFIRRLKNKSFDLVIEARGDIRELLFLVWPLKTRFKVSYNVGGGGYLLTHIVPYEGLKHKVEYHLDIVRHLGCSVEDIEWGIYLTDEERFKADVLLSEAGVNNSRPLICIHPGGRKELKCWSPEGYARVADIIADELDAMVLLTGAVEDIPLVRKVEGMMKNIPLVLAGKTTIRDLAAVISRCSLFICNDSAPMHIAAAMNIPTVAIFGPSKSIETAPYGKGHMVVEKEMPCRYRCDEDVCLFKNHHQCMKEIFAEDVVLAVKKTLSMSKKDKEIRSIEKIKSRGTYLK